MKDKESVMPQEGNTRKDFKMKLEKKDEEIAKLNEDIDHWKNEYYRAYADTQNLRKSLEKDHQEAIRYRASGFVESLLNVLDGFHMALSHSPSNPEVANYVMGFSYIYKNLVIALEEEGVSEISPNVGDKFNPAFMEAIASEESEGDANIVLKVSRKGYKLHDRLIRPAEVTVSKKIENNDESIKE